MSTPPDPTAAPMWLPWNHPLRAEAERLVREYYDYSQTHLPSDQSRYLENQIVVFAQKHAAANESEARAIIQANLNFLRGYRNFVGCQPMVMESVVADIEAQIARIRHFLTK